jgi:sec-independent protein translocase protein TatA
MLSNFAILDFGAPELIIILAIVLLLFGGKKLPELTRSMGESVKNLREGFNEASSTKHELNSPVSATQQSFSATPRVAIQVVDEHTA